MVPPYEPVGFTDSSRSGGRWRYERRPGIGIAVRYAVTRRPPPDLPRVPDTLPPEPPRTDAPHAGEATILDRAQPPPPYIPRERTPEDRDVVRVLCSCGTAFAFDGDAGHCPSCGRLAEWPAMGLVEREMRTELDQLLGNIEDED